MGRPTKLTPDIQKAIVKSLSIGATRKDAVLSSGVSYQTFLNWMKRGRAISDGEKRKTKKSVIYVDFFESVSRAEATARLKFTSVIAKAASDGDWRAALEFLSRRDRANWSPRQEITGADGKSIAVIGVGIDTNEV